MRLSSQVGIGSKEQDFAGIVDSTLMISCTDVGSSSVSGSTSLGMMTGAAAAAVDARILATLSTKNLAKSSALRLSVADCDSGCSRLLTVFHSARGLRRHVSIGDSQRDENLAWNSFFCA